MDNPVIAAITATAASMATTIATAITGARSAADLQRKLDEANVVIRANADAVVSIDKALREYQRTSDAALKAIVDDVKAMADDVKALEKWVSDYQRDTQNEAAQEVAQERDRKLFAAMDALASKVEHLTAPQAADRPHRPNGRY